MQDGAANNVENLPDCYRNAEGELWRPAGSRQVRVHMDVTAIIAAGIVGIVGAVAGGLMTHFLEQKSRRKERAFTWELERLSASESSLKALAARITFNLVVPNPFTGYRALEALRDLAYVDPYGLDAEALNDILEVLQQGVLRRGMRDLARHWLLGDTRRSQTLALRLAKAEMRLAASIRERRSLLLQGNGHEREP